MTKEELAQALTGREIGNEMTPTEESAAKESGLVVIFGASDDLCELRGAIEDELGAYKEALVLIKDGKLLPEIEDDDIATLKKYGALGPILRIHDSATKISARWHDEGNPCWSYDTKAPHATFDILEDGEKYCVGIVLDLKEIS